MRLQQRILPDLDAVGLGQATPSGDQLLIDGVDYPE